MKNHWQKVLIKWARHPNYFKLTPQLVALESVLDKILPEAVKGRVLDLGAGRLVYKAKLEKYADSYTSLDIEKKDPDLDIEGSAMNIPLNADNVDTVFCSQVLEHVPHPEKVIAECARICKTGGHIILTVPHLSPLHDEPGDFFRYTRHGIRVLLEEHGFHTLKIEPTCGILTFLMVPFFQIGSALLAPLPIIGSIWLKLSGLISRVLNGVDALIPGGRTLFPVDYVAVGRRR